MKREVEYVDQARDVMAREPGGMVAAREEVILTCQEGALKILTACELHVRTRRKVPAGPRRLTNKAERVHVWFEVKGTTISCFAIEFSPDGGRTRLNPLDITR